MRKFIKIECFQHKTKVVGKDNAPFRLYVIYREDEINHLAFNNSNWVPEFTNEDNLAKNYFKAIPDDRLELVKQRTF